MLPKVALIPLLAGGMLGCVEEPATGGAGDSSGKGDVWGEDDRKELFEIESAPLRAAAQSSGASFVLSTLVHDAARDTWSVGSPTTLGVAKNLCAEERFIDQPSVADCSGTLIGDDIMLTAAHCFDYHPCSDIAVVFDFAYESSPTEPMLAAKDFPGANVYKCTEILAKKFTVDFNTEKGADYAVIRLDRKVTGRTPALVNWSEPVEMGRPAYVIGHPSGLPQKLSTGAILDGASNPEYVVHDADVFGGNSGGGLFDAKGTLIGIHVRSSAKRYIPSPSLTCNVAAVCGENADCMRKPHAYDPRALKTDLSPELRTRLGIPL